MRKTLTGRLIGPVVLAALLVAGCSSSSSPASSSSSGSSSLAVGGGGGDGRPTHGAAHAGKVTIITTDRLMFAPSVVTAGVGMLTVTLRNDGSYPHNLVVPRLHVTSHTVSGDPGATSTTVVLHFPKPGRYRFVCTYHASAGMRGEFVVR